MPRKTTDPVDAPDYGTVPMGTPLAPPPDDLDIMMSVEEPLEELKPFGDVADSIDGSGSVLRQLTDPGLGRTRRPQGVSHVGPPMKTLYNINGDSRSVNHTDVPMLVDRSIPANVRLYIRCPLCKNTPPHFGFHTYAGLNQCPGKNKLKWSACPICRNHGIEHRVFEDEAFDKIPRDLEVDSDYVAPRLPDKVEREERLRDKLDLHMVTFHAGEAYRLFGLRRRAINNGQAFVVDKKETTVGQEEN